MIKEYYALSLCSLSLAFETGFRNTGRSALMITTTDSEEKSEGVQEALRSYPLDITLLEVATLFATDQ